jgi:thiol-disulfide isomerase/thioredoxin
MVGPASQSHRVWRLVLLGFVLVWCAALLVFGPRGTGGVPRLRGTGLDRPAAYDWMALDLDDRPVAFARYQGKPVFLNIWATWCPPCVEELPSIARLAANPRLKDIAFVCISTDERAEDVRRFLRTKRWGLTFLRTTALPKVFLTDQIPATFVIAADGRIVATGLGSATWDDPSVVAELDQLVQRGPTGEPRQ